MASYSFQHAPKERAGILLVDAHGALISDAQLANSYYVILPFAALSVGDYIYCLFRFGAVDMSEHKVKGKVDFLHRYFWVQAGICVQAFIF